MRFSKWLILREHDFNQIAKKAKLDISSFDKKQITKGFKHELEEHGKSHPDTNVTNNDPVKVLKIVVAHLREDPKYYSK